MKAQSIGNKNVFGFATIEILIAFAIIILCIGSVVMVSFGNQTLLVDLETSLEAISKAGKMLEDSRVLASRDFYSLASIPAVSDGIYQKTLNVEDLDAYTKKITSNVSWRGDSGRNLFVQLVTLVSNPTNMCSLALKGDWSKPKIINSANIDLDSGNILTDISATSQYAYITSDSAAKSNNDFYIVDTSNPSSPVILSALSTGPGLNAVSVFGNYAYVANSSTTAQLQVIDITDKNRPILYKSFKLPASDSDLGTVGYSILYDRGKVYLTTKKIGKAGLHVIDVSDLSNIKELGYFELSNTINQILIFGNYAYLAGDDSSKELQVLNISNPTNIFNASIFNSQNSAGYGFGKSIAISGSKLFLGTSFDHVASNKELNVIDITNPTTNPLPALGSGEIGDSINGLINKSNLIFLVTNSAFQIRSVSDLSLFGSLSLPSAAASMDCAGDYFYLGLNGSEKDVLKIIGSSP